MATYLEQKNPFNAFNFGFPTGVRPTGGPSPSWLSHPGGHRPEFVLLDIGLPGMDGYEVATRLREDDRCRGAVIIAISGYGQEDDRRRSASAGIDHLLVELAGFDSPISLLWAAAGPR